MQFSRWFRARSKAFRSVFVQFNIENVDQIALGVFDLLLLLVKHCLRDNNNNKFYDFDCTTLKKMHKFSNEYKIWKLNCTFLFYFIWFFVFRSVFVVNQYYLQILFNHPNRKGICQYNLFLFWLSLALYMLRWHWHTQNVILFVRAWPCIRANRWQHLSTIANFNRILCAWTLLLIINSVFNKFR